VTFGMVFHAKQTRYNLKVSACVCVCLRERERERERERTSKLALSHDFLQLGNKVLITALSLTEI